MNTDNDYRNQLILLAILLSFLIALFAVFSCRKTEDGFDVYIVKAGENECNGLRFIPYFKESLDFEFQTNDTWIWTVEATGWSKITGIGWMWDHQENRCELGYKYLNGYMIIGGYANADGERFMGNIDTLQTDRTYFCRISLEFNEWVIRINGKQWKCPAGKDFDIGVRMNPYAGGTYVLNEDWKVLINFK